MNREQVYSIVYKKMQEDYYKKLRTLESDIDFFTLYMKRNKKSDFNFELRISYKSSFRAFNDIWKKYGYHKNDIEIAFAEFMLLKMIIEDVYNGTNEFTIDEIKSFIKYFEMYQDTFITNYIGDFINCS